jgi:serine/threonine protein kinase
MYCANCGVDNIEGARYCIKCGADLTRQTPPEKKCSLDSLDVKATIEQPEIEAESFAKGSLFANRYEILSEGLKGGMGVVYKCKDSKLNRTKAVKVIHPRLLSSSQSLARFRQEVAISQELQHENIVRVYDI